MEDDEEDGFLGFDGIDNNVEDDNGEAEDGHEESGVPNLKSTKQRSNVWQHFDEIILNGVKYAKCKRCDKKYKISGTANGSTGNMNKHLRENHPDLLEALQRENDSVFIFSQEEFRKALLKWVLLCDQAFKIPQHQAFKAMVRTLNPEATLYSDKTIRADLIDTFNEKFNELKIVVSQIPGKIAITMDGWTSKNVLPFLAVRGHWLDVQHTYQSQLLDFCYIEGAHSGATFNRIFSDVLRSLGISMQKIVSITVDNVSSNDTFFDELAEHFGVLGEDQQVRCLAHIINLAAQDVLASLKTYSVDLDDDQPAEDELESEILVDIDLNEEILDYDSENDFYDDDDEDNQIIVVKLRNLVRKIRKSVQMRQKLNKLCTIYGIKYLVPILDCKTRWNSTYDMILRAEHLKTPLRVLCSAEKSLCSLRITERQWLDLYEIKHLLQKFQRATQFVSMERQSTIHAYLPTLDWLIVSLKSIAGGSTGLHIAAIEGLKKLQKYEKKIYESKIPFIATFLNPALKLNYFKEQKYTNAKIREIKTMVSEYLSENYGNDTSAAEEEVQSDECKIPVE